jgi:hypothetical protein
MEKFLLKFLQERVKRAITATPKYTTLKSFEIPPVKESQTVKYITQVLDKLFCKYKARVFIK